MTTGQKLLELRKKAGVDSQAEMAWLVFGRDMTKAAAQSKWKRLEKDQQEMTIQELQAICRYFDLPVNYFIDIKEVTDQWASLVPEEVRQGVAWIYQTGIVESIKLIEGVIKGAVTLTTITRSLTEILRRMGKMETDIQTIIKTETPGEKPVALEVVRGEAAAESTNSASPAGGP